MSGIRLHILGLPHTITRNEFSHCAFTGKVLRFAPMMRSRGFEVFHYGVEGSQSGATQDIQLMTDAEWRKLRVLSYTKLNPDVSKEDAEKKLADPTQFIGDLANWSTPLYQEFNMRLRLSLLEHYRSSKTDIVCLPFGKAHDYAIEGRGDVIAVESGIGYPNSERGYRIFESYAWLHHELAREKKWGQNYWFVCPNYFDSLEWPLSLTPHMETVGFLGRIYDGKGCNIVVEVAKRLPHVRFILCGQGDPSKYLTQPNIHYKPPIHGTERAVYLGSLQALIAPTGFIEPFCGVVVEAQLCGTPAITTDYGAQTETVEPFKTGMLCHTLQDYCRGVQWVLDGNVDRRYVRERAVRLYDILNVARKYEYAFKSILDVHNGNNGWYSPESYVDVLNETPSTRSG